MPTWTVVKFLSDNSIEAVPTNWLDGNQCYWPRFEPIKMAKAIRNCDPCLLTWEKFTILSFRNGTYDNYIQARSKCQKALVTSDLNSDGDQPRRRRKPQKLLTDSSSSSSDTEKDPKPSKRIDCPTFQLSQGTHPDPDDQEKCGPASPVHSYTGESYTITESDQDGGAMVMQGIKKLRHKKQGPLLENEGKFGQSSTSSINSYTITESEQDGVIEVNSINKGHNNKKRDVNDLQNNNKCKCDTSIKRIEEYCKQVLRKVGMMELIIADLKTQISELAPRTPVPTNDYFNIWEDFSIPLNIETELETFELFLKEAGNFTKSAEELSKVGGGTVDEFVKRCMKKLITNTLQKNYSWLGKKNKKIFATLELPKLIKSAAWKNNPTTTCSEKDVEHSIQKYLRRAREREEAEIKRQNK